MATWEYECDFWKAGDVLFLNLRVAFMVCSHLSICQVLDLWFLNCSVCMLYFNKKI